MKTLIVSGGKINIFFLENHLKLNKYDIIIAIDKGLESLDKLKIVPNYILGDFDSIDKNILKKYENIEMKNLNPEKDYTDTHAGINLAIELKSTEIIIIGAIGTRIDHTVANIHILKEALDHNIKAKIINEKNEIELINKKIEIEKNKKFKYISIIPLTSSVTGITIKGMKYTLSNYTLQVGKSIGISNEQIEKKAFIQIENGILIIIKSKD